VCSRSDAGTKNTSWGRWATHIGVSLEGALGAITRLSLGCNESAWRRFDGKSDVGVENANIDKAFVSMEEKSGARSEMYIHE